MNSFKQYLQSQDKSKSTVAAYQRYILEFITWLDMDNTEAENVTTKEVMSYLSHLQKKGLENKTRAIRLGVINHFYDYQIQLEHTTEHPSKHIKIRGANTTKLTPILSKVELEEIYTKYSIPTDEDPRANRNWFRTYKLSKQRNKVILSLLVNQGLTTAEVNKIEVKDLKLRDGEIYIHGSRKSNERTLKLKSNQIMDLMEYLYKTRVELIKYQENEKVDLLFLPTPVVSKKSAGNSLNIWKRLAQEIKEEHPKFIRLRQIRTSVITHWLKQYNLREVQYMAGHRYVSTTERYFLNQTDDLLKDIDQFHPLG
tara:strand:- start:6177 stop:7112 length:936 start_codon:yes stop_codon:yes gene_type:complete